MASSWIKVEVITPDKPEIYRLAEILNIDPDAVLGKAIRFWAWADQQTIDGNANSNATSVTKNAIDRITFMPGFATALIEVGWLHEVDGVLILPNFGRHNGESSKKRALTSRRVTNVRDKKRKCNADSVTGSDQKALPEEEEEEEKEEELKEDKNLLSEAENQLQTDEQVFISLPLSGGHEIFNVTENYVWEMSQLYPAVNVQQELRSMRGWLGSNPKKRKTKAGIKRFITTWLQRCQDKPSGWQEGRTPSGGINTISAPDNTIPPGFRG